MKKVILKKEGVEFSSVTLEESDVQALVDDLQIKYIDGEPELYAIEIEDLSNDYDFSLELCHTKRRQAYPSLGDQLDALYKARKGDDSELKKIDETITQVKMLYPKPTR